MPRAVWPLLVGRPRIQIVLTLSPGGRQTTRELLADSGGGSAAASFELILDENDCLSCGGKRMTSVQIGGRLSGLFPIYRLRVQIPQLGFDRRLRVAGVPSVPSGLDGIACFRFLNQFTYGNFGDPGLFGLES
jgi:hypothetical protein